MNIIHRLKLFQHLIAVTLLLTPMSIHAGSVLQVGIARMMTESELVIHGEVVSRRYEYGHDGSQIYTRVQIHVIDVIKGNLADDTIELNFLGGTIGRQTLNVSDQFVPSIGDEAVYFVEDLNRLQVNPIYGWRQGHFPVRYDEFANEKFAMTHDLRPIYDVLQESWPLGTELTKGIASGVLVKPSGNQLPLSLMAFKSHLRAIAASLR